MEIVEKDIEQGTVVSISGRLDAMTSIDAQKTLLKILNRGVKNLFINFENAVFLSSAGLCALLIVAKRAKELKANVCLVSLSPQIRETLEITGFLSLLKTYPDVETAIKHLAESNPS